MAAMIEEDVSLDDDDIKDGDDDGGESYILPNFMPAAWDIMQWFPRRPEAAGAATKARAFHETFSTPLHNMERVWFLLDQEELQPPNGHPKQSTRRPTKRGYELTLRPSPSSLMRW